MAYSISSIKDALVLCSDKAIRIKPLLTELDSRTGDGDLGMSMSLGATAVKDEVAKYEGTDIGELFMKCALALNKAAPSTMGTLISGALMMVGKKYKGLQSLEENMVVAIPVIMADSIMMRGNAQLGDKTILDALIPLHETLNAAYRQTSDLKISARQAADATKKAAKSTKGMIAKVGRAKWIADRSRDYPDGGAVLCCLMMEVLVHGEKDQGYILPDYETGFQ